MELFDLSFVFVVFVACMWSWSLKTLSQAVLSCSVPHGTCTMSVVWYMYQYHGTPHVLLVNQRWLLSLRNWLPPPLPQAATPCWPMKDFNWIRIWVSLVFNLNLIKKRLPPAHRVFAVFEIGCSKSHFGHLKMGTFGYKSGTSSDWFQKRKPPFSCQHPPKMVE